MIGKLLGVATVGTTVASVGLMHRFLSGMAKIMVLAIVSAFMVCAMLASVFTMTYFCLVHYGLDPYVAGITLGIVALFLTIALVMVTVDQIRHLRDLSHFSLRKFRSDWPDIGNIASAFIDGFLDHKK
jgi:hypothetical protein